MQDRTIAKLEKALDLFSQIGVDDEAQIFLSREEVRELLGDYNQFQSIKRAIKRWENEQNAKG